METEMGLKAYFSNSVVEQIQPVINEQALNYSLLFITCLWRTKFGNFRHGNRAFERERPEDDILGQLAVISTGVFVQTTGLWLSGIPWQL